jgi:carbonic anhydrase/acetyltransferase-like protein (isoleucine patch superfamily)
MKRLKDLIDRIIDRVNINLREPAFDVGPYVRNVIPPGQFVRFYAFYGLTRHHPLHFHFNHSNMAGSYFLGKCTVDHSVLYKTDVRGDELKAGGDIFKHQSLKIPLHDDEVIRIKDSFLIKNLVHSNSHDPESPEDFTIKNTISMHYANIHGSPVEGSFLGPFSTVDLTTLHDCVVGEYAYVQTGEAAHRFVEPGQIWIQAGDDFKLTYRFPPEVLKRYVDLEAGKKPRGILIDFVERRKKDFVEIFEKVQPVPCVSVPEGTALSRYAVVRGKTEIRENVLVAQRAYLEDASLGKGSNVQENCYILKSSLEGDDVTAHGGKIIHAQVGKHVFVGFNSFLRGRPGSELKIGEGSIIMPHTIMDLDEPLNIPERQLVWGYVRNGEDLKLHSLSLEKLSHSNGKIEVGGMRFEGSGAHFVEAFQHRIHHILESNGAFFHSKRNHGHAQKARVISFNTLQPYLDGEFKGLYPTIDIRP